MLNEEETMRPLEELKGIAYLMVYAIRCLLMFTILLFPVFIVITVLCSCTTAQLPENCKVRILGNDITTNQYERICD